MPEIRNRRDVRSGRPGRRLRLLVPVAVLAAAALGAAAFPGGTPPVSADVLPAHHAAAPATAGASAPTVTPVAGGGTPVGAPVVVKEAGVPARPVVHTMSMDAPIQGGLTAHQEQAVSARLVSAHRTPAAAPKAAAWTPAMGLTAVARAESWLGMPYSWAGGSAAGPTLGRCEPGSGGDLDCHVVGFDCSGLAMYAWGAYQSLPHLAAAQIDAGGYHPTLKQLLPGDLVFFSGYLSGGIGHVAIYAGAGTVIEAPQSGSVVRRSALADLVADDGYRGAVRPLTAPTPTLTAPDVALQPAGGLVTLHGTHLAGVDTVHIGNVAVQAFARHSDTAIVLRAPAHAAGRVRVTVSTSWAATSKAVVLAYVKPHPAPPIAPSAPATPTVPLAPVSTTEPTSSTPPTNSPTPAPHSPSPTAPSNATGSSAPSSPVSQSPRSTTGSPEVSRSGS